MFKAILSALFCTLLGGFLLWWMGPSIMQDYKIKDTAEPSLTHRLTDGHCRTRFFLIATCDLELTSTADNSKKDFSYLLLGRMKGEQVTPMIDKETKMLTTSTGLNYLWNRIAMLLLLGGGFLLTGLVIFYKVLFNRESLQT